MNRAFRTIVAFVLLAGAPLAAADPAYVGKWKFNAAKSTLAGDSVTIGSGADGMMTFDSQGFKYSFKTDGKDYQAPDGSTVTWKPTSADAWDVSVMGDGKPIATYHVTINGATMNLAGKLFKQDGSSGDFSASYKRVSGSSGLAGKWTSTEVKPPVMSLEVAAASPDGVTLTDDSGAMFQGQFDGKDMPAQGRLKGSKVSTTFKKSGASGFVMTTKVGGKEMVVETYSVSPDGKTLTINGTPSNAPTEKYKVVFDRQ